MKTDRLWRHLAVALGLAVLLYVAMFAWLEHRRTRLGPWEVTFVHTPPEAPRIIIHQPGLKIREVTVLLPENPSLPGTNVTLRFDAGRVVPFDVPFGRCVHQDPLFLPGVVALELAGQSIQMLPPALYVNDAEHPWQAGLLVRADHHKD